MRTVPSTEFAKNFGRYRDLVQREPVAVTSHDRISGYFISDAEYAIFAKLRAYLPQTFAVEDLPADTLSNLEKSTMNPRHAHLDRLLEE